MKFRFLFIMLLSILNFSIASAMENSGKKKGESLPSENSNTQSNLVTADYTQCQEMEHKGKPLKDKEKIDKVNSEVAKCNENMNRINEFVNTDGLIDIQRESLVKELENMEEKHLDVLKEKFSLLGGIGKICSQSNEAVQPLESVVLDCESNSYMQKHSHLLSESDITNKEVSFVKVTSDYTNHLCGIGNQVTDENERLKLMAKESVKMVGYCYAKKKLEYHVAVETNHGIWKGNEKKANLNGSECVRPTRYTVDYNKCKSALTGQNAIVVSELLGGTMTQTVGNLSQQQVQKDYRENIAQGQSNFEAGLNMQKNTFRNQRDGANVAAGAYSASAATLTGMLSKFPSEGSYSNNCEKSLEARESSIDYCLLLTYMGANENMFANKIAKNKGWEIVGLLGAKALKNGLEAWHFNQSYKGVKGMQNDYSGVLEEVATIGFDNNCESNPTLCNNQYQEGETSTFNMGNLSFGNGVGANSAFSNNDGNIGDVDSGGSIPKTVADRLNDSLNGPGSKLSDSFKKVAPGKLKGASQAGGGGGGASAGGGASGGGAGGADENSVAQDSSSGSSIKGVKASWKKGRSGKSSFARGKGKSKKKSSDVYSGLFKKNKGRSVASKANDIASKDSELFKKISSRYEKLNSKNRLKKF